MTDLLQLGGALALSFAAHQWGYWRGRRDAYHEWAAWQAGMNDHRTKPNEQTPRA